MLKVFSVNAYPWYQRIQMVVCGHGCVWSWLCMVMYICVIAIMGAYSPIQFL